MKVYYKSAFGADMVFIHVSESVVSATGYAEQADGSYDFRGATFAFFIKERSKDLKFSGEEEIPAKKLWDSLDDVEWFKQKLIETVL